MYPLYHRLLLLIDLDPLKNINHTVGPSVDDGLLRQTAGRCGGSCP